MLLSIAWKNIWRKPARSLVLVTAIIIGLAGGIFTIALSDGMLDQRNEEAINLNYSHLQIHNPDFKDNQKIEDSIKNVTNVISDLNKRDDIKSVTSRLNFLAMATTARSSQGVMIYGINPKNEKKVTTIYKNLIDSSSKYISSESNNEILISSRMAQNLKLVYYQLTDEGLNTLLDRDIDEKTVNKLKPITNKKIRLKSALKDSLRTYLNSKEYDKFSGIIVDLSTQYRLKKKIILRFNKINGDLVDEAFKVVGIYKTNDANFDNMNVFVNKKYICKLLNVPTNTSTEIAAMSSDFKNIDKIKREIQKNRKHLIVESFSDLDPMAVWQSKYMHLYYMIIIAFILFALSFGIINTILMSVMERTKELGMLMSIGMKKGRIFTMIMFESIMISLTGGVLGMLIGAALSLHFGNVGIDTSAYAEGWESFGFSAFLYPKLSWDFFLGTTILVILTGIISAIYPARRALKLNPSEALRSDA